MPDRTCNSLIANLWVFLKESDWKQAEATRVSLRRPQNCSQEHKSSLECLMFAQMCCLWSIVFFAEFECLRMPSSVRQFPLNHRVFGSLTTKRKFYFFFFVQICWLLIRRTIITIHDGQRHMRSLYPFLLCLLTCKFVELKTHRQPRDELMWFRISRAQSQLTI